MTIFSRAKKSLSLRCFLKRLITSFASGSLFLFAVTFFGSSSLNLIVGLVASVVWSGYFSTMVVNSASYSAVFEDGSKVLARFIFDDWEDSSRALEPPLSFAAMLAMRAGVFCRMLLLRWAAMSATSFFFCCSAACYSFFYRSRRAFITSYSSKEAAPLLASSLKRFCMSSSLTRVSFASAAWLASRASLGLCRRALPSISNGYSDSRSWRRSSAS